MIAGVFFILGHSVNAPIIDTIINGSLSSQHVPGIVKTQNRFLIQDLLFQS